MSGRQHRGHPVRGHPPPTADDDQRLRRVAGGGRHERVRAGDAVLHLPAAQQQAVVARGDAVSRGHELRRHAVHHLHIPPVVPRHRQVPGDLPAVHARANDVTDRRDDAHVLLGDPRLHFVRAGDEQVEHDRNRRLHRVRGTARLRHVRVPRERHVRAHMLSRRLLHSCSFHGSLQLENLPVRAQTGHADPQFRQCGAPPAQLERERQIQTGSQSREDSRHHNGLFQRVLVSFLYFQHIRPVDRVQDSLRAVVRCPVARLHKLCDESISVLLLQPELQVRLPETAQVQSVSRDQRVRGGGDHGHDSPVRMTGGLPAANTRELARHVHRRQQQQPPPPRRPRGPVRHGDLQLAGPQV